MSFENPIHPRWRALAGAFEPHVVVIAFGESPDAIPSRSERTGTSEKNDDIETGPSTRTSQRQDASTDEGHQHQSADAPGERRQRELHVIGFEYREGVDGDGIGKTRNAERPR